MIFNMGNKKLFKYICLLFCFCLTACENKTEEEMVRVSIYKYDYINLLSEEDKETLANLNLELEDCELSMIGDSLSLFTFKTIDGNDFSLPEKGPYILEILSAHCKNCLNETANSLQKIVEKNITVYQYFINDSTNEINEFYLAANMEIPDGVTVLKKCEEFEQYLIQNDNYAVPQILIINEDGLISMSHIGYMEFDSFISFYEYGRDVKLYETLVDDMDLHSYISKQNKIRAYIGSLQEIDVPASIFEQTE